MVVLTEAGQGLKEAIKTVPEALMCMLEGKEATLSTLKEALDILLKESKLWGNTPK